MPTTTRGPLAQHEIVTAAKIIEGCRAGAKVTWAVWAPGENPANADVSSLLTGSLRYIERTNHATGAVAASEDIRDQYVRVTTTFEHWLLISDVLTAIRAHVFVFDR